MPHIIQETDRAAELHALQDELQYMKKRLQDAKRTGKRVLIRQIAQIERDIVRNQEQMRAIL